MKPPEWTGSGAGMVLAEPPVCGYCVEELGTAGGTWWRERFV
jgi:hypothetical protein